MPTLDFEGRRVPLHPGDTVASALFRSGVRIFSRSFKYHRPRGLYCLTGDCPNCLLTVDGESCVRACVREAKDGMSVRRGNGWPSADKDALAILWSFRRLLPVGFYYKTFLRPRRAWPLLEPWVARLAGIGPIDRRLPPARRERQHHTPDLLVVGGGVAGLSAALVAAGKGERVLLVDEGRPHAVLPPGAARTLAAALRRELEARSEVELLDQAAAVGVYEGPLVPVASRDRLHLVHAGRVIVATGAVERSAVFPGGDLPGVWLGRGAARLAAVHGLAPGRTAVFVGHTEESLENLEVLRGAGVRLAAVLVPADLAARLSDDSGVMVGARVVAATGRRRLRGVVVERAGTTRSVSCDALILALGLEPRDGLLRQAEGEPVCGAGEVLVPGCGVEEAAESGRRAALGESVPAREAALPATPRSGIVCPCEDVSARDLELAWEEGFRSTELLKRYTTITMGPCQGAMCQSHLRGFVEARDPGSAWSRPTTARPPGRPIRLEEAAAGVAAAIEHRTALHARHLELGAVMEWAGAWKRPESYGDPEAEYWAVRDGVSVMDLGTLGKYEVAGPDATEFLERLYPCRVADLAPGRFRYSLVLNEAGYVFDDGLICALEGRSYYLTFTTGGAAEAEAWMRDWAETWGLRVHVMNLTATVGAIILAGPRARELLAGLSPDPVDREALPHTRHRDMRVADVPCRTIRSGFVGELGFELHHPADRSVELWDALLEAGLPLRIRPHGLEALRLLRLEKGHIIVGQDTDFDSTPAKLGMNWTVKMEKPYFIGRTALARLADLPPERKLVPLVFPGPRERLPVEGAQLLVNGAYTGELTSCRFSPVLGHGVALGWIGVTGGRFPERVETRAATGEPVTGTVATGAFYDPRGERLRA